MKRIREFSIVALVTLILAGLLTGGLLIAQTSLTEIAGIMTFRSFDPKVRHAGNLTFEDLAGTQMAELSERNAFHLVEAATVPATADVSSSAEAAIQVCNDTLVITYNNAGTMRFKTIDLDGSDTSWADAATPPATCGVSW